MPLPTTASAQGATITFATSAYSAGVLGFGIDGVERTEKDVTNLATTGNRQYKPGSLVDRGTLSMRVQHNPESEPPIAGAAETITIAFETFGSPTPTIVGTGFVQAYSIDGNNGDEEEMTAELTIRWDGNTGPTWS